jgi:hypothetical protein
MKRIVVWAIVASVLSGCGDQRTKLRRFTPIEADSAAQRILALTASGNVQHAFDLLYSEARTARAVSGLEQIVGTLAGRQPRNVELIGSEFALANGHRFQNLVYEAKLGDAWLLAYFRLVGQGNSYSVSGFRVNVLPEPQRVANGFWENLRPLQAVWLFLSLATVTTILVAIVRAALANIDHKWLWILFSSVGFVQLTINWTTEQISIRPVAFHLLGVGVFRLGLYAPLLISWSLPVGAIWTLWWVRRHGRERARISKSGAPRVIQETPLAHAMSMHSDHDPTRRVLDD